MSQNNQNTFEQQGSRLQQLSKSRKSNLAVAVFAILAFHAAVFGGLLIQGCKPEPPNPNDNKTETNQIGALVVVDENPIITDPLGVSNSVPPELPPVQLQGETNVTASAIQPIPPIPEPVPVVTTTNAAAAPTEPKAAPATATEYLVVQNDNFYSIAKKFPGVSVADIKAANPDVDPTRMKVGQKLVIPAPKETPAKAGETAKTTAADSGNTYTVVAGDNLTVIAKKYKITVAELKKANNMTTDRINVGQKLQIPAASTAPAAKSASAPTASSSAAAAPATAPASAPAASEAPVVQTPPSAAAITNTITKTPL